MKPWGYSSFLKGKVTCRRKGSLEGRNEGNKSFRIRVRAHTERLRGACLQVKLRVKTEPQKRGATCRNLESLEMFEN